MLWLHDGTVLLPIFAMKCSIMRMAVMELSEMVLQLSVGPSLLLKLEITTWAEMVCSV